MLFQAQMLIMLVLIRIWILNSEIYIATLHNRQQEFNFVGHGWPESTRKTSIIKQNNKCVGYIKT